MIIICKPFSSSQSWAHFDILSRSAGQNYRSYIDIMIKNSINVRCWKYLISSPCFHSKRKKVSLFRLSSFFSISLTFNLTLIEVPLFFYWKIILRIDCLHWAGYTWSVSQLEWLKLFAFNSFIKLIQ